ncbi:MAG: alpha/beta hydrolase [Bacteroidota bacterium]
MHAQQTPSLPLVLFHGLLSSAQEFGLIAHWLRNNGVPHQAPGIPGYTLATDVASPDWRQWRDAAVESIDSLENPDQPIILGGLCMGGVLAAAAALKTRRRIAGLILMSPTFDYDGWGLSPIRHLRHLGYWTGLDRFFSVAEREPFGVKNEKIRKWVSQELKERANSAVGPSRIPLPALREGERMMAQVRAQMAEIDCPLLVIHAKEDEITSLASVRKLFEAVPVADKELAVLENSYHMITIDNDRHEVARLLAGFVKRVSASFARPGISLAA